MKKVIFLILGILFSFDVFAQALKSGFQSLNNNKFDDAVKVFSKAMDKGTETVAAMYGLGCVLCNPEYSNPNYIKGFRFIRNANDRFNTMSLKNKSACTDIYGFNFNTIHEKMCAVAQSELEKIKKKNTVEDYEWFVTTFEGADSQVQEALALEAKLVWTTTCNIGTFRAYKDFYDKFPNSEFAEEAKTRFQSSWKSVCDDFYSEGELSQMQIFALQYPNYPFYTQENKDAYSLAQECEKLKMAMKYNQTYESFYTSFIDKAAPSENAWVALQRIISPYLDWGRFVEAAQMLESYKNKFPNKTSDIDKLIAILKSPTKKLASTPFPNTINTKNWEYAPVITPDGNTLYFCGNAREDNIGNEDIFVAKKVNGQWQQAVIFGQFNTALGNEAPLAVSPDGNMLLIYKDSNIYYTEKTLRGWSPLKKMSALNTDKSWEADAWFSNDGNAIFFISDRKGNVGRYHPHEKLFHGSYQGNTDIYVCVKNSDGEWDEPINLGDVINTPFCERSPVLASDMKTLYFSSDGHYGLGHLDVFKSTRLSDTSWTQWSEPVNLGKEINTANDDYNYVISTDGVSAYFSKIGSSGSNICSIDLPESMRPEVIASVFGKVTDDDGKILAAKIKWEDLETGKLLGDLQCDPVSGTYFITLPAGRNYGYFVDFEGYYPVSGHLNTDKLKEGKNIEHNIVMYSIEDIMKGDVSVTLSNIFFDTDKFELKPESYPELKRLASFIKSHQGAVLEISGHTDNVGSPDHNKQLSQKRAESVKKYLISIGCSETALKSVGYGSEKPIVSNTTEDGKARNRRVEFKIVI
ncbi:MAG: OmpA family protein [Bacteroidales bacterium]|nr:OmpA family protein [Bacteroidales bacterium]